MKLTILPEEAARFLKKQKRRKVYVAVFLCLALVVAGGTAAVLRMRGQAKNYTQKVLACQLEIHEHTEACRDSEGKLICGYADYVVHTHNDDCYDADGVLVCTLPEIEKHEHTESCYAEEKVLICEIEESSGHVHTEECHTVTPGELICTLEEHTHGEECYDEAGELTCTLEEHTHSEECYGEGEDVITCGMEEGEGGHTHTDECYTVEKTLICGKDEIHTHDAECYDAEGNLICEKTVLEEHVHGPECFVIVELTPEEVAAMNGQSADATESTETEETETSETETLGSSEEPQKSCYDAEGNLVCGLEEHTHTEDCYDEKNNLICEIPEHVHVEAAKEVTPGTETETTVTSEIPDGSKETQASGSSEEAQTGPCYDAEGNLICGLEEHTHTEDCYDAKGTLTCEIPEHVHTAFVAPNAGAEGEKVYHDAHVIITASYGPEAGIPEEAQLRVYPVTEQSDPKRYEQRVEQALEETGRKSASQVMIYNIGFYLEDVEVKPKAPVTITVQFLNEAGFAAGDPVTVVHFSENGTEALAETELDQNGNVTFTSDTTASGSVSESSATKENSATPESSASPESSTTPESSATPKESTQGSKQAVAPEQSTATPESAATPESSAAPESSEQTEAPVQGADGSESPATEDADASQSQESQPPTGE